MKLNDEELALIEAKREQERQAEEERQLKAKKEYDATVKRQTNEGNTRAALAEKLVELDVDNIFIIDIHNLTIKHELGDFTIRNATVKFILDGYEHFVDLEYHMVSRDRWSMHANNKGMKFHLYGDYNNYKHRWIKNPASLIKSVKEMQTILVNKQKQAELKASLAQRATQKCIADYPHANVTFEEGYDFGHGHNRHHAPDRIKVETKNGSITFTFYEREGVIFFNIYKRVIGSTIRDRVDELILSN